MAELGICRCLNAAARQRNAEDHLHFQVLFGREPNVVFSEVSPHEVNYLIYYKDVNHNFNTFEQIHETTTHATASSIAARV